MKTVALLVTLGLLFWLEGCQRTPAAPPPPPKTPTVRLYAVSTLAGAMEPCGCRKDMLGGVDHAAAFIESERAEAPDSLVLGAGPMLFMNPKLEGAAASQDRWKAQSIADALGEMKLRAWAPGANDWAAGPEALASFAKESGADLLGANLTGKPATAPNRIYATGGVKVGVTGVSDPKSSIGLPPGVKVGDPAAALKQNLSKLRREGAEVFVALMAMDRGAALRLAEAVPGFDVAIVGKASDRGEGNDAPIPPVLVGGTLVVQAPNHLQAIAAVDLFVRGDFDFQDAAGIAVMEKRESLERRVGELQARIKAWEASKEVAEKDLKARRADLTKLRGELQALERPVPPAKGSFFKYELFEVSEKDGSDPKVSARMAQYYRKVNEHNRVAFKDRKPEPVPAGQSGYLGAEDCSNCHEEEAKFWKTTRHAKAYASLSRQHKQFNLDCVNCHVTGYDKPGGSTVTHVDGLQNVQCEACHGPGSRHEDDPENADWIVRKPSKDLCVRCHHPPHVADDWSADAAWKHIIGPGHGQ